MEKTVHAAEQHSRLDEAWALLRGQWAMQFKETEEQRIQACVEAFRSYCRAIRQEQLQGRKGKIAYITFSMLRTTWLENQPAYLVEASDALWVLDPEPIRFEYDAGWLCSYWLDLQRQLQAAAGEQQASLSALELEQAMLEAALPIHSIFVNVMRLAMRRAVHLPEFQELDRAEVFEVRVGEYLDQSISVYKEDRTLRDANEVKQWLEERREDAYCYQVLTQVELPDGDYSGLDFRYTAFRRVGMKGSRLQRCVLVGTVWRECELDEAGFAYSMLHGADFSGCSLKGAVFDTVTGSAGYGPDPMLDWEPFGYAGVDFTGADLKGASFKAARMRGAIFRDAVLQKKASFNGADLAEANFIGADLTEASFAGADLKGASFAEARLLGADFTGACLLGADFTGSRLEGADFTGANLQGVVFTDEQRHEAVGLEGEEQK
ncbi:pentapeptide repeat-containing protein [Paenibacillus jiagnxiensis]